MGVSTSPNPNMFAYKIENIYSVITKSCKVALMTTVCTSVHSSIHSEHEKLRHAKNHQ